ncbi:MAG: hypothetical protein WC890_03690 [Candidatus Margulisiibacteriota bacterium]
MGEKSLEKFLQLLKGFSFLLVILYSLLSLPAFSQAEVYPQLDISGYKKWEYKGANVSPSSNYFSGLTMLGGYYPTFSGGPWQERLRLGILGQLSEDLAVSYDLEQQPENPDRFDVKVKYKNSELTFGDFSANFAGNEFAATSRYLNGVKLTSKDSWYDVMFVPSTKLKSQTQALTTQSGNNTKGPYNLGHGSIIEGSEKIQLNNVTLTRNVDYTIDYFEGKVIFSQILTTADQFKYSYEYTNIIDLFFPSLSKKDFIGFQSRFAFDPEKVGKELPKEGQAIGTSRETFPSLVSGEADEFQADESSGIFRVKNTPVVLFSEQINFMGTILKKNEDYIFRYDTGEIKLLTRFLPSKEDPLLVTYQYFQISKEAENIQGIGSRGLYYLSHKHVVADSEKIVVDGNKLVRQLDYSINYDTGEILFSTTINTTSQINANYQYAVVTKLEQPISKNPTELKLGVTYLQESAKAGETANSSTAIESFSGSTIITNNYHLYLNYRPVVSTGDAFSVTLTLDGRLLTPEVDYAFPQAVLDPATGYYISSPEATLAYKTDHADSSNGYYFGTIKLLSAEAIASTSEAIITYTYYKSVVGRYSGGGDGTRGPYYLRNIRNVVPGSEVVQVWTAGSSTISTFTRNTSFEANAGDTGYSINYSADLPSITFNNQLDSTKSFQIIYQYVPPTGTIVQQDITQSVVGVDGAFKIGNVLKIDTAYARSTNDQYIVRQPTSEAFSGNGTKTYTLHAPQEIIDGSERLYVNNKLLNKDIDYYVSYTAPGSISLYYLTLTSADAVWIDYDYQSSSGGGTVTSKTANAYRIGAETKLLGDSITINGTTKKIDYDFSPLGGTAIGVGSNYTEYNTKIVPPSFHDLSVTFSYKENNNPIGAYQNYFTRTYDNSFVMGINPHGLAKVALTYRNYRTLDDLTPSSTIHSSDTYQESYDLTVVPLALIKGAAKFTQDYEIKKTASQTDSLRDSSNYGQSNINYLRAAGDLYFTERFSAGYNLQVSEPQTISLRSVTGEATTEAVSYLLRTYDNSFKMATDLTAGPIQKFIFRFGLTDHIDATAISNFSPTSESLLTRNETYHIDFVPISILTTTLDKNRQEKTTYVIGGTNPKTDRLATNVALTPLSWLAFNWANAQSETVPETGAINRTTGVGNTYSFDYKPAGFSLGTFGARFTLYNNMANAPTGTTPEAYFTNTNSFAQNYTASFLPLPGLPISASLILENYSNLNNHPTSTSKIDTETQNKILALGTTILPLAKTTFTSRYNYKITSIVRDLNLSPQDRGKSVFNNNLSYQVYSWGTISYTREDEINGGEVQAGAVSDLNYYKVTQTYSANITLPIDNPVLNSFVFTASLKNVGYINNYLHTDDFNASLLSFEGTLNF